MLAAYHFYIGATVAAFGISTYLLLLSLIGDIKVNFNSINKGRTPEMKRTRIRNVKQLCEFVEIHANSMQLS